MRLIRALNGHTENVKPIWLMRQAGRYLPEYRALRESFSDFMAFCFNREAVVRATLQPIERFDFDAAIIFSDILVVPHFLGQRVSFKEGVGPLLEKPDWEKLFDARLGLGGEIVYESIREVRQALDPKKALIGFVGCPWTIASYMINEGKTNSYDNLRSFVCGWVDFERLLDKLVGVIAEHAVNQLRAGADVVQLFESWAAEVPPPHRQKWLFSPAKKIIEAIRKQIPGANIVYYGKGVAREAMGALSHLNIGFGISHEESLGDFCEAGVCLQGNLSPQKLLGGDFEGDVLGILEFANNRPFIVNLGHGILPQTPIKHVEKLVDLVRCQR